MNTVRWLSTGAIVLCVLLLGSSTLWPQTCDVCSRPKIALYDFAVLVPRPTVDSLIVQWFGHFDAAGGMRDYMQNSDPTRTCYSLLDGAMLQGSGGTSNDTLRFGTEYANLPPAGPIKSSEYLITGSISGSEGNYVVEIELQASMSRKLVASARLTYANPRGAMDSGRVVAAKIGPLFQTIRNFEIAKRNSDVTVAMRNFWDKNSPPDLEVIPLKKIAVANETIDVNIKLIDCDGVALQGRTIILKEDSAFGFHLDGPTRGHFESDSVVTGSDGIAKAKFTAGSTKGLAYLPAYFVHHKPHGAEGIFMGDAYISVEPPPPDLWLITAIVIQTYAYDHVPDPNLTSQWWSTSTNGRKATLKAVVKNTNVKPFTFDFDTDASKPESYGVTGSGSASQSRRDRDYLLGGLDAWSTETAHASNIGSNALSPTIKFHFDSSLAIQTPGVPIGSFDVTVGLQEHGTRNQYGCTMHTTPPTPPCGSSTSSYDVGTSVTASCDTKSGTMIVNDQGWTITFSDSKFRQGTYVGTETETTTSSLQATIVPFMNTPTFVQSDERLIPLQKELHQNYPNPFNPTTTISFNLPSRLFVSLRVYDALGREVSNLCSEELPAGTHSRMWDATNMASGVYFYRLQARQTTGGQAGSFSETKKLVLIR